ncbi:MAG: PEP-CTERM sorting domain-containing protein [Akkermansiaceae bacterium]
MIKPTHITTTLLVACLVSSGYAASISVNISPNATVDNQRVDAGETAFNGIADAESVDGSNWNNLSLGTGAVGNMSIWPTLTQGGNHVDLTDSSGIDSGVNLTSSGSFYSNYANASTPNQGATGDGGLMQGYINLNSSETISLSGLAAWAPNGYKVVAAFDIGPLTRTYGVSMNDGGPTQIFWTADTAGADSDTNNDGVIGWIETTATTSGTAVSDANYAIYGTFTGDTLTISGDAVSGRGTLNGFQIIAVPEPSSTALLGLGGLALILRRRK